MINKTKMQRYEDYMAIAVGPKLKAVMPCCSIELEFLVPWNPKEVWDSTMECPNCGAQVFKMASKESVKLFQ